MQGKHCLAVPTVLTLYLNYYLSFDVCARFRLRLSASVCVCLRLSVCVCELFNGCIYQRMLVYKVDTFLKRIKMAISFLIFLDQIKKPHKQRNPSINKWVNSGKIFFWYEIPLILCSFLFSDFQSWFSMSKIIRICLKKNSLKNSF